MARKKYEMCKNWKEKGICRYGEKCLFAHGAHELSSREDEKKQKENEVICKKIENIQELDIKKEIHD